MMSAQSPPLPFTSRTTAIIALQLAQSPENWALTARGGLKVLADEEADMQGVSAKTCK